MYHEKLVVALKVDGKILREIKDCVYIPFGKEYSIFIKNLNSVRAAIRISIDGKNMLSDGHIVLAANGTIDLERGVFENNLESGNKFKFIEPTEKIENHRGINAEDGLVRIEFEFEDTDNSKHFTMPTPMWQGPHIVYQNQPYVTTPYTYPPTTGTPSPFYGTTTQGNNSAPRVFDDNEGHIGMLCSSAVFGNYEGNNLSMPCSSVESNFSGGTPRRVQVYDSPSPQAQSVTAAGITVPGSESDQKFTSVPEFKTTNQSHVIVLKLIGELDNQPVKKPVTVKTRLTCETCGTTNEFTSKFCGECGTYLKRNQ